MAGSPPLPFERAQSVPLPVTVGFALAIALMVAGVAAVALGGEEAGSPLFLVALIPAALVIGYVTVAFRTLRVRVDSGHVHLAFGSIGPRKRIDLADVRAARPTRSRPLYGWGMRAVPGGVMWNVWGLDAVELDLANGRRFWIGTDRPGELALAIERALGAGRRT